METKSLNFEQMTELNAGTNWGCAASVGLAVSIWSVGVGMVNPLAGMAVGYLGGLATSYVCA